MVNVLWKKKAEKKTEKGNGGGIKSVQKRPLMR